VRGIHRMLCRDGWACVPPSRETPTHTTKHIMLDDKDWDGIDDRLSWSWGRGRVVAVTAARAPVRVASGGSGGRRGLPPMNRRDGRTVDA
jgi:hypothetical protein